MYVSVSFERALGMVDRYVKTSGVGRKVRHVVQGGGGNSHPENIEDAVGLLQEEYQ
jgi:hypothetical protein